ncbi:hypothetical protein UFOVP29_255 [uncultured Caudovirales phage]|uniref:Uncharacterized protein n=1 Tax=uncultured Caudovirales phage TaxID=2100421 RepID=A0A6J5KPA1_9CAUD|nr:hypothetical protein UFOVP29_255 [uncultured Caudovirales phage]
MVRNGVEKSTPFLSINIVMAQITDKTNLAFQPYASKFFLQGEQSATNTTASLTRTPRYKFMYYARFVVNQEVLQSISAQSDPMIRQNLNLNGWQDQRSVSFLVKKLDRPKIELNTVETNQYNLRKQNYTRATFQPITMTLFDTSDNRVLNMWINYFRYYFSNARANGNGANSMALDTPTSASTASNFDIFQSSFGMSPGGTQYGRNFFLEIEIYAVFGGKAQLTRLIAPRIASIDWGSFDSSDSGVTEVTMTFKYENIEYADDVDLQQQGLLDEMGFINGYEPPSVYTMNDPALSKLPQPAPFDGNMPTYAPTQPVYQAPSTIFQQQVSGPYSQIPQSVYIPFIGAVGGAVNISPVISPFGILVFGL